MTKTMKIAWGSLLVGFVVLAIKALAWWMTGSVALYSDAMESIVNVATAIAALVAIRVAAQPADATHPYGHHKAEYFSAVLEGVMIVIAALLILHQAWLGFTNPQPLDAPLSGVAVNLVASVMNGVWCWVLLRTARTERSPALAADGRHLLSDVISSVGVTIGVLIAIMTGLPWLDPAMAALVALNILWSGYHVITASLSGLLDESLPEDILSELRVVISDQAHGAVEVHDLRSRQAGTATFIEFHLVVDGGMSVDDAHVICDRIEAGLLGRVPECVVTIHVEPEHKAKHSGIVVL
jgi:cation diffusion facilitator family transporter